MRPSHPHGETVASHCFDRIGRDTVLGVDVFQCARCELMTFARSGGGAGAFAARYYSTDRAEPRRWVLVSIQLPCRAGAYG